MKTTTITLSALLLAVLAVSPSAEGNAGCVPIATSGFTINGPGCFFVSAPLGTIPPNVPAITINDAAIVSPGGVEIDLCGHEIVVGSTAVGILSDTTMPVTIRNGNLVAPPASSGGTAIQILNSFNVVLENITIQNFSDHGVLLVDVGEFLVDRVLINNTISNGHGIRVTRPAAVHEPTGTIRDSEVANANTAIEISEGESVAVLNNRIRNVVEGIRIESTNNYIVADNTVSDVTGGAGIFAFDSDAGKIRCNVVSDTAAAAGIAVWDSDNTHVVENTVSNAAGIGVHIFGSSMSHIERNLVTLCANWGLLINGAATDNVIRGNVAFQNGGAICNVPVVAGSKDVCDQSGGVLRSPFDNFMPVQV